MYSAELIFFLSIFDRMPGLSHVDTLNKSMYAFNIYQARSVPDVLD